MGLCFSFDCGDCDGCINPCCLALSACCLVPCLCPNACGQQQQPPQTVIIQQPTVVDQAPPPQTVHIHHPPPPPETIHIHHPTIVDQQGGYPYPPSGGYPGYPQYGGR